MTEAPLPNTPEARTPTGEIKDQTTLQTPTPETTPPSSSTTPEPKVEPKAADPKAAEPTLLTQEPEPKPEGAPEKYEAFKVPEGTEINPENMAKAETMFKEMGLSQDKAQKLIDFYGEQMRAAIESPHAAFDEVQRNWQAAAKADPEIGPHLRTIQADIGRAFDSIGDPKLVAEFKQVMNATGAGDNPAFIKIMARWGKALGEGTHVSGKGPSPLGQGEVGRRPSAAHALYPNLPSSQSQSG